MFSKNHTLAKHLHFQKSTPKKLSQVYYLHLQLVFSMENRQTSLFLILYVNVYWNEDAYSIVLYLRIFNKFDNMYR